MSKSSSFRAAGQSPRCDHDCLRVRDVGRKVDRVPVPQVGDLCPLCGKQPITVLGLTKCSTCGAAHADYIPRKWRFDKPGGVTIEPWCDSMERRALAVRLAVRDATTDEEAGE